MLELQIRLMLSAVNSLLLILVVGQIAYFMLNPQVLKINKYRQLFVLSVALLVVAILGLTVWSLTALRYI